MSCIITTGCQRQEFDSTFYNKSDRKIWVDSAMLLKTDIRCGVLISGAHAGMHAGSKPSEMPKEITIKWWHGNRHNKPKLADKIFTQTLDVPPFDRRKAKWELKLEFTKDETWRVLEPKETFEP